MYMNNNGVWIKEKKIVAEEEEMPYKGFFSGIKWTAQELYKVRIKCMHMLKSIR